jgi:hypothetical protein
MKPKTINTLHWTFTTLFSALMLFSAWSSILVNPDAVNLIHGMLGYPEYFVPFTGWAKLVGAVVILIPGFSRVKEWAYAGLFFDLLAVVYSGIAVAKAFDPLMLTMLIWIVPGVLSYIYWHKKRELAANPVAVTETKTEPALSY